VVARRAQRHGAHGHQRLPRPFVQGREEALEARIHDGQYHVVQRPAAGARDASHVIERQAEAGVRASVRDRFAESRMGTGKRTVATRQRRGRLCSGAHRQLADQLARGGGLAKQRTQARGDAASEAVRLSGRSWPGRCGEKGRSDRPGLTPQLAKDAFHRVAPVPVRVM
jgi:hypothetical protein